MTMASKQKEKLLALADLGVEGASAAPARRSTAAAAPVRMMDFKAAPDPAKQERLEGVQRRATSVRQIDAALVHHSRFANRHEDEFATPEFRELADDIKATGGNTVPGKVRKLHGEQEGRFELIFGHRRHRACLEGGLPFLAEVCEADDRTLFEEMTRENLFRKDPAPWDWSQHYALGLKTLYANQEEMAKANGKSKAHVSLALQLADLPDEVVEAFASPTHIQMLWGPKIQEALKTNRASVLKRAEQLKGSGKKASDVLRELLGNRDRRQRVLELKAGGREVGEIAWKAGGGVTVKLNKRAIEADRLHELRKVLQDFLAGQV